KKILLIIMSPASAFQLNSKSIDTLMQKLSENETQNTILRREILEREKHIKELSSRLQLEKVNAQKEDHLARSANAVLAHLRCQIQRKEVENDELKVKIQTLEKKIAQWKLQVDEYKHQMLVLRETSEQEKTALKRAVRSQKQRAEHFEAAVENLTSRIREREARLSEILSVSNVWKKQHDRIFEGKTTLEIQTEDLKKQITSLLEDLKRKEEWRRYSDEEILGKLNSVNSQNEKIYLENEKLRSSLATLENSRVSVEEELLNLQEKAKLQENLVEQYKNQVTSIFRMFKIQKSKYILRQLIYGFALTFFSCDATMQVRDKTEAELKELEHVCDLLKADEEKQREYQKSLCPGGGIRAQKSKPLRLLQVEEEDSVNSMGRHSLEEENHNIQKKYEDLKRQLEKMEFQNEVLAHQLRKEDEILQCSQLQLEEKIAEYNGLTRQLQSALEEGKRMVAEELEKISCKEQALQTKILGLETEVRERQEEKKQLLCIFHHNEKHYEVRLKELENSLQKSENKNQSIQNYLQFLKASYITIFG
ncbi:Outer dense fiber protein 2-like, partial [Buceros rhinoceros silvestris]